MRGGPTMKIAAYVPIKLNNSRMTGKNIKQLYDGTPLCKLLFESLSKVKNIDEKYCFCSDTKINEYLVDDISFLQRDSELDKDEVRCDEIIKAFVDIINPDVIVLTHVTSPFLKTETIEKCVEAVKSGKYDSAFTVEIVRDFLWMDGKPMNFDASCTPRSQDLPEIFKETNGVFVFTKEVFEKTNRRIGYNPYLCKLSFPENMDVNYPEDFIMVDAIYKHIKMR